MEAIELKKEIDTIDPRTKQPKKEWVGFRLTQEQLDAMTEEERKTFIHVNQSQPKEKPKSKQEETE